MAKVGAEGNRYAELLQRIPKKDKEVILLAAAFFQGKWVLEENTPVELIREEKPTEKVVEAIINSPNRASLFPGLQDEEISNTCWMLDKEYKQQQMVIGDEGRSFFDAGPKIFAVQTAAEVLQQCAGTIKMGWFGGIKDPRIRGIVIAEVLKEIISQHGEGVRKVRNSDGFIDFNLLK